MTVRYRKGPHMQNSMRKLKLTLTLTLTLTDTGGAVLTLKVGFHYPSSRAELTARELGCIFDTRQLGP